MIKKRVFVKITSIECKLVDNIIINTFFKISIIEILRSTLKLFAVIVENILYGHANIPKSDKI